MQYLVSVIDDGTGPATPTEAADLDVALELAAEGSKCCHRKVEVREAIARVHHEEWVRVVAALTRRFGDLDIAEEATAEAFATAVAGWPADGVPPTPGPG